MASGGESDAAQNRAGTRDGRPGGGDLVRLGRDVVSLAQLRNSPGRYVQMMTAAKVTPGHAECLCRSPAPRLVIRQRDGRFHLACWPGNGSAHRPQCDFYRPAIEWSGRAGYHHEAISDAESGTRVQLAHPLATLGAGGPDAAVRRQAHRAAVSRSTTGLLGLAHLLWENAQLNCWAPSQDHRRPGHRGWAACHTALQRAAAELTINGTRADHTLYVVPPFSPDPAKRRDDVRDGFLDRLHRPRPLQRRGLVMGEIKEIRRLDSGQFLVRLRQTTLTVFFPDQVWEKVRASCRSATAKQLPDRARQVLTVLVERPEKGYLRGIDAAVLLTNDGYIPCDSSYEVRMADHLTAAGRTFVKPLRYDLAEAVFPDFVLTDTPDPVIVEVWGVLGRAAYETRKREKQHHYRDVGIKLIEWDVTGPPPQLPQPPS